jgi:hypothetical protein
MIELQYRAGLAYPPSVVFGALTDVPRYPLWQSDVAAAMVRGGGPLGPGAEITQVRRSLGRRTCLSRTVVDYDQDRLLTLGTVMGTRPSLRETFLLWPGPVVGCCVVTYTVALGGVPLPAEALEEMLIQQMMSVLDGLRSYITTSSAEDSLHEELGMPHDPLPGTVDVRVLRTVVQPEHTRQRHRADQRVRQVLG